MAHHFVNMDLGFVVAAAEGFTLRGELVIRELTLIFPDGLEQHFIFCNPENFVLSETDRKTVKFTERYLNGFSASDNKNICLPHSIYPKILEKIQNCRIYCAGETAHRFFARHLPYSPVIDVYSLFDFKYPNELENPRCFKLHRYRYCSLAKARFLRQRLEGYRL